MTSVDWEMIDPKVAIRGFSSLPLSVCAICRHCAPESRMILIAPRPALWPMRLTHQNGLRALEDQLTDLQLPIVEQSTEYC